MRSNKVEYSTATGLYCRAHEVKVSFYMTDFSSSNKIEHHLHVNNDKFESGIGYDTIIGRDMMVQFGPAADFKHQLLQWYGATVPMKEPIGLLGKSDLNKHNMREVVIHTTEPAST